MTDWIEVNLPVGPVFTPDGELDSMCKRGMLPSLIRPGVEFEIITIFGRCLKYLTGGWNHGDPQCINFPMTQKTVVTRYRVLWEGE